MDNEPTGAEEFEHVPDLSELSPDELRAAVLADTHANVRSAREELPEDELELVEEVLTAEEIMAGAGLDPDEPRTFERMQADVARRLAAETEGGTRNAPQRRKCAGRKKNGEPCGAWALRDGDLCPGHAGKGVAAGGEISRAAQQQGAKRRSEQVTKRKMAFAEALRAFMEGDANDPSWRPQTRQEEGIALMWAAAKEEGDWKAIEALFSRAFGRPREHVITETRAQAEMTRIEHMTEAELDAELSRLLLQEGR